MSYKSLSIFLLRVSLGWLFFYAGITKVMNPAWSAEGYLKGATTFSGFYQSLLTPQMLPVINLLNEWGLTLIGVSLILGLLVRLTAPLGAVMMLLYYFPILDFPMAGEHSFIVDDHIIYAIALLVIGALNAGQYWGMDSRVNLLGKLKSN